jgi:hypothetical protein
VPSVIINAPAVIGACAPLVVDLSSSSGSGGRYFSSATFQVDTNSSDLTFNANIEERVQNFISSVPEGNLAFTIPYEALATGAVGLVLLDLSFTLTNFMGKSSAASVAVILDNSAVVPNIIIAGPLENNAPRFVSTKLSGLISFLQDQTCLASRGLSTNQNLILNWSLIGPEDEIDWFQSEWVSPSGTDLIIPAYWFDMNTVYTFEFSVTVSETSEKYTALYPIQFTAGVLGAGVIGGSRSVNSKLALELEAEVEDTTWFDDEELQLHIEDYSFQWSCQAVAASGTKSSCFNQISGSYIPTSSGKKLQLPGGALLPSSSGSYYLFQVNVVHQSTARTAVGSASIFVVAANIPKVVLISSSTKPAVRDPLFFIRASLPGVSDLTSYQFTWVSLATCKGSSFTLINASDTSIITSPLSGPILSFSTYPPALIGGQSYCIGIFVRQAGNTDLTAVGQAQITFSTRVEPSKGSCRVVGSASGSALQDLFTFRCTGWITDSSSGDLFYQFFMIKSGGSRLYLAPKSKLAVFTTFFGSVGSLKVYVEVSDSAGGISRTVPEMQVTVTASSVSVEAFLQQKAAAFRKSKNVNDGLKMLSASLGGLVSSSQGNGLIKRDTVTAVQVSGALRFLRELAVAATLDYSDIGPTITSILDSLVNLRVFTPAIIIESLELLSTIASNMDTNAKNSRTCFSPISGSKILNSIDILVSTGSGLADINQTLIAQKQDSIIRSFSACLQRQLVCGGANGTYVTNSSSITLATVNSNTTKSFGIFSINDLAGTIGSDCVSYKFSRDRNYLPVPKNSNISSVVYSLDFRNNTLNSGGIRRGTTGNNASSDIDVQNLVSPVVFTIALDANQKSIVEALNGNYEGACLFYLTSTASWSRSGCTVSSNTDTSITCSCTHLTEFAIQVKPHLPPTNPTNPPNFGSIIGGTVGGIACVALVGFVLYKRSYAKKAAAGLADANRNTIQQAPADISALASMVPADIVVTEPRSSQKPIRDPAFLPDYQEPPSFDQEHQEEEEPIVTRKPAEL